ncbi:MAG: tetratricopeptide repeat protein [Deltaproteobacteria bacterium]|nr:MAG: tetratricopeptide repeat protein [Deltaproteobacteria bacterium]
MIEAGKGYWEARLRIIAISLILLISALGYFNSLENTFHFDDRPVIEENPNIRDVSDFSSIVSHNPSRPILFLSIALNYYFSHLNPFGYHLVNLLLHGLTSILLYLILYMSFRNLSFSTDNLLSARRIALFSSIIYATLPVHTESVSYIASRSSVLCTSFYLLSLYFFIKVRSGNFQDKKNLILNYLVSLFSFLLALGTKEIAVTLPVVLLLYEYSMVVSPDKKQLFERVKWSLPFLIILVFYFILRYFGYGTLGHPKYELNAYSYFITELRVVINYLRLIIFPLSLNFDPDFPRAASLIEPAVVISVLILGTILAGVVVIFRRVPTVSFGIMFFFITLLPTSSIVPLQDVMAEHRLYLPTTGFCLIGGVLLSNLFKARRDRYPRDLTVYSAFVVITLCFTLGVVGRNLLMSNDYELWKDTVKKSSRKARPHNNLGKAYFERNRLDQAIEEFKEAIRIDPDYADAHNNLGAIYVKKKLLDEAIEEFKLALLIKPDYADAHHNLGVAYEEKGLTQQALEEFQKAQGVGHNIVDIYHKMGTVHFNRGMLDEAIVEFNKVLKLNPDYTLSHYYLGKTWLKKGKIEQAIAEYQEAIRINPNFNEAYLDLGNIYFDQSRYDEAAAQYHRAVEITPGSTKGHSNLGIVYEKQGKYSEAITEFDKVLSLKPTDASTHKNLGVIYYYKVKDHQKALEHFRQTLRLNPNQGEAKAIRQIVTELENKGID